GPGHRTGGDRLPEGQGRQMVAAGRGQVHRRGAEDLGREIRQEGAAGERRAHQGRRDPGGAQVSARVGLREHRIGRDKFHHKWDNSLEPVAVIDPGDVVHFETEEVTAGQLQKGDPPSRLGALAFDRLSPLGRPGFLAGAGPIAVLPPTKGAGNVDTRHLTAGTKLYLPVFVPGGLFSAGDCHAAQGDGEVCVTGIECPMTFSLRFGVVKGGSPRPWSYHFVTPAAPLQPRSDAAGYHSVAALGPDLMENARNAVRYTIEWLVADHGLSREDAYILCSLAGDLRISQIVDQPNWGVSFYLPLSVFS